VERLCPKCGRRTSEARCPDDGTVSLLLARNPESRLAEGAEINGRYRIGALIGQGGFGAVYRGKNLATDQDVAIKLLAVPLDEGEPDMILRFFAEAQVTASLKHPNTIRVFDFGQTEGGALYIAMELLTGRPLNEELRARLQQGRGFGQDEVIAIASQVLRSLAEAHAANLVHRDLKPHNIFLHTVEGDDAVVKVLDFGIAKRLGSNLTGTGKAFGTPTYMSPEQAQNRPLDRRSDLYALGCVLFQLLAGRPPFDGENPLAVLLAHVTETPPDLRQLAMTPVSEALVTVIERALAKDADARFATAIEMRQALEACRGSAAATTPAFTQPLPAQPNATVWSEATEGYDLAAVVPQGRTTAYSPARPEPAATPAASASSAVVVAGPQREPPTGPAPVAAWTAVASSPSPAEPAVGALDDAGEDLPARGPRRRWGWVLAIAVAVAVAAATWGLLSQSSATAGPPLAASDSAQPPAVAAATQATATAAPAPADAGPPNAGPPEADSLTGDAAPTGFAVEVASVPPGAEIAAQGAVLGKAPQTIRAAAGKTVAVSLQLAGYRAQTVAVTSQHAPRLQITLQADGPGQQGGSKPTGREPADKPPEFKKEAPARSKPPQVRPDPPPAKEKSALEERL
jgi:serine/threonine protein kinase